MNDKSTRPLAVGSGFIDLQVNGFGGINFSSENLSLVDIGTVVDSLIRKGTLAFCPTVITASMQVYQHALPVLAEAMHSQVGRGRLLGIHLEGPFLSPENGARGVHPREHVQQPSRDLFDALYRLADGKVGLLTIAPELPGALEIIHHAAGLGIAVSIGHTMADADTVRLAVSAGARQSTHLGNGCPNLIHRHHNSIWPQLAASELSAMLITDGHHLPPEMIAVFLAAKGAERVIVTSDASPAAGCLPGEYTFFGSRVLLEPGGRLRSLEQDTLAGSSATMFECMNFLSGLHILSEDSLWRVGRDNPLEVLGKSLADLPSQGPVFWDGQQFQLIP